MLKQHRDSSHSRLDFVFFYTYCCCNTLEWLYSISYQVSASHLCYYLQAMKITDRLLYLYWILDCVFLCCSLVQAELVQLEITDVSTSVAPIQF